MRYGILLASVLTLAACQQESSAPAQASAVQANTVDNRKTYVVMTELNTLPFIIRNKQVNGLSGFEYDLLTAIAEQQGFKLRFDVHPWQGLFKNLDTGKADILAGAVTYTAERAKIMDFSNPHFEYHYAMLVRQDFGDKPNFEALRGLRIALQRGSVSETLTPMFAAPNNSNLHYTDTIWLATKAVLSGEADGAIGSSAPLSYYAKEYASSNVKLIQDPSLPAQHYVFAVKKGNTELVNQLNEGLAKIKANGTYDALYKKYW